MEGAELSWARLEGANLYAARLEGANLRAARLEGVDLSETRLQSVDWVHATFAASLAHAADFSGGRNLTQSQLTQVIGDSDTVLPLDAETGEQLYVMTCWVEPPPTVDGLLRHRPEPLHADLRAEWLCPPGDSPERTGRPAAPAPAAAGAD